MNDFDCNTKYYKYRININGLRVKETNLLIKKFQFTSHQRVKKFRNLKFQLQIITVNKFQILQHHFLCTVIMQSNCDLDAMPI